MTIEKERLIYTAGTFKIDDNFARCRRIIIRTSVLRLPFSALYRNERSNPAKYFLGYVTTFIGEYVVKLFPIEFEQQIVFLWDNLESQVYARVICDAININLFTSAARASIPQPGGIIPVPGDPGTFPGCPYNFIKFKLEPGARILVSAVGEELETCPGGEFTTSVPDLAPPPALFPDDQARDEDPPRSPPEEGELPGDTSLATADDPDSGLLPPLGNIVGFAGYQATGEFRARTSPPSRVPANAEGNFVITYEFYFVYAGENVYDVRVNGVSVDPGVGYRLNSASWILL